MLSGLLRLIIFFVALAGLAILFFYAFIAALIITPILFVLLYLFGRKANLQWTVMRRGQPHTAPRREHGPVIDHDPNDLPPPP